MKLEICGSPATRENPGPKTWVFYLVAELSRRRRSIPVKIRDYLTGLAAGVSNLYSPEKMNKKRPAKQAFNQTILKLEFYLKTKRSTNS
jgi:hypothetical protein